MNFFAVLVIFSKFVIEIRENIILNDFSMWILGQSGIVAELYSSWAFTFISSSIIHLWFLKYDREANGRLTLVGLLRHRNDYLNSREKFEPGPEFFS